MSFILKRKRGKRRETHPLNHRFFFSLKTAAFLTIVKKLPYLISLLDEFNSTVHQRRWAGGEQQVQSPNRSRDRGLAHSLSCQTGGGNESRKISTGSIIYHDNRSVTFLLSFFIFSCSLHLHILSYTSSPCHLHPPPPPPPPSSSLSSH